MKTLYNYEEIFNTLVEGTGAYLQRNNLKAMILGISGGIDSTITAAICSEVSKNTGIPLYGVSLMCTTNEIDEVTTADKVGERFCTKYLKFNMQDAYEYIENYTSTISESFDASHTPLSNGNIKARLRMITLYDLASTLSGIVMDTDNLTEHYLGFWTIHGDEGDLNPIGNLWKTEVYRLSTWAAEHYKENNELDKAIAIEASINLVPTDGNGVKAGGDLAQIAPGLRYTDVDKIIRAYIPNNHLSDEDKDELYKQYPQDIVDGVIKRIKNSEYKRKHRPLTIKLNNGMVEGKDS